MWISAEAGFLTTFQVFIAKFLICTAFLSQDTIDKLHPLPLILNRITESLGPDVPRITVERCDSLIFYSQLTQWQPKFVM